MIAIRVRRWAVLVAGTAGLALVGAAAGWACTGQGTIGLSPAKGPAGAAVRVDGTGFGANPVDIRWGSASGPLLGTAANGTFSVNVTVPQAGPGVYYVIAVPQETEASRRAPAPAAFRVEAPAVAAAEAPPPAVATPEPVAPEVAPAPVAAPAPAPVAPAPAPAARPQAAPAPVRPARAVAPVAAPPAPVPAPPVETATAPVAQPAPPPEPAPVPDPAPSPAVVAADVWQGFDGPTALPAPTHGAETAGRGGSSGRGAGLAALGAVMVATALAVGIARGRRPSDAGPTGDTQP